MTMIATNVLLIIIGAIFILLGLAGKIQIKEFFVSLPSPARIIITLLGSILLFLGIFEPLIKPPTEPLRQESTLQVPPEITEPKQPPTIEPKQPTLDHIQGFITVPRDGAAVSRAFRAEGTIKGLPSNCHLWLAVEHSNLSWPKGPIRIAGTQWSGMVYEGGQPPDGHFDLSLYVVDSSGNQEIIRWSEDGAKSGYYPGFGEIPGGKHLYTISLKLQE